MMELTNELGARTGDWYIYALKCTTSNRIYVGRTRKPRNRQYAHLSALRSNRHYNKELQKDYNAFGEDTFEFVILEKSAHEMNRHGGRERYWMEKLRTYNVQYGYNNLDPKFTRSKEGR